jgi:uncharacterized protein
MAMTRSLFLRRTLVGMFAIGAICMHSPRRAFASDTETRVWLVGDSTVQPLSIGLERNLEGRKDLKLRTIFRNATGLARPDFFDWPKIVSGLLEQGTPDVVFITLGSNDTQGLAPPGTRMPVLPTSPEWRAEYGRRLESFANLFKAQPVHIRIYLVLQAYDVTRKFAAAMSEVNEAMRETAARMNIGIIDAPKLLANENGEFQKRAIDSKGNTFTLRSDDGVHLTARGGAYLARRVLRILDEDMKAGPTAQIPQAPQTHETAD